LQLKQLRNPKIWTGHGGEREEGPNVTPFIRRVLWTIENLPPFIALLQQESDELKAQALAERGTRFGILTVVLPEESGMHSRPERLAETLVGVDELYGAFATLAKQAVNGLSVVGCDSGSDKSFDFFGNADVIAQLKEFILSMWDRVIFYRESKMERRLELISESLPIIAAS
jgi:hypothetical protein